MVTSPYCCYPIIIARAKRVKGLPRPAKVVGRKLGFINNGSCGRMRAMHHAIASHPHPRPPLPRSQRVVFAAVTCIGFFGLLEAGARLAHGWHRHWLDCHRPHAILGWSLRENWAGKWSWTGGYARINAQGIRDDAPVLGKQPGERRLLILGDSVTFGASVATDQTYPQRLQAELATRGSNVRVLNGGVTSYDPSQEADWLELFGWKLEPDQLAVAFCANDLEPSNRSTTHAIPAAGAGRWLTEHSIIAFKLQRCVWRMEAGIGDGSNVVINQEAPLKGMPFVEAAYRQIAAAARERNVPVTLIVFPNKQWLNANEGDDLRSRLGQLAGALNWHCIDLTTAFATHANDDLYLPNDPIHPSSLGYAIAARAIADGMDGR